MSSSQKLLLLIFSAVALIVVSESRRTILLEEEENDLERLLNYINKPPIKSLLTVYGDILDCIDINKQLAFDHPLLRNHTIQLRPTTIPKWTINNNNSRKGCSLPFGQECVKHSKSASLIMNVEDGKTKNWWLMVFDELVGCWPNSLFTEQGLGRGASLASWGGEVYSPVKEKSPSMGSGHFPREGYLKAAYVSGIEVIDEIGGEASSTPNCYKAEKKPGPGSCTF